MTGRSGRVPPYKRGDHAHVLHCTSSGTQLSRLEVARCWPHKPGRWAVELAAADGPMVVFVDDSGRDQHGYVEPSRRRS